MLHPYAHYIARAGRLWPDRLAAVDVTSGRDLSWGALANQCAALAGALRRDGVGPRDRVAVIQANSIEYLISIGAIAWSGAAFAPLLGSLSAQERDRIVEVMEPSAVLDAGDCDHIGALVSSGTSAPPVQGHGSDVSQVLFTSGSTGQPKGVVHDYRGTEAAIMSWLLVAGQRPPTVLVSSPISHAAGRLVEAAMPTGGTVVILETARSSAIIGAIERYGVTHMLVVPTVLQELVDDPSLQDSDLRSLEFVMYSAAPASPGLLQRAQERLGSVLHTVWGATECPAPNTWMGPAEHAEAVANNPILLRSCGREFPGGVQVRVVDETFEEVAAGVTGQIVVSAPWLAVDYLGQSDLWSARMRGDCFLSGDVGFVDDHGYLFLAERKEDLIISGGFNVYPTEVENALLARPEVAEASVVGAPHPRWGEQVMAVIVLNSPLPEDELLAHCRSELAAYKVPKGIVVVDALPRTGHGKVSRRLVREEILGAAAQLHGVE
jgi:fatty-acyl-CoA synthase